MRAGRTFGAPTSWSWLRTAGEDGTKRRCRRKLRSHGEFDAKETKIAIIGRPNVGKSTLLNALTGNERAIVSPIAGTTRDAVDEVVERGGHSFRFVDTAGIRRKGKTKLMAEKLSVIMARKHLEAADVSLLVIDAGRVWRRWMRTSAGMRMRAGAVGDYRDQQVGPDDEGGRMGCGCSMASRRRTRRRMSRMCGIS
jgi:predicted GTPase